MNEEKREEQLFESVRNSVPELGIEEVQKMIGTFASLPSMSSPKNNWTQFIHVKNGLMIFIPVTAIVATILLVSIESKHEIPNAVLNTTIPYTTEESAKEEETLVLNEEKIKDKKKEKPEQSPIFKELPTIESKTNTTIKTSEKKILEPRLVDQFPKEETKEEIKVHQNVEVLPRQNMTLLAYDENNELPTLSNNQLRKLKRSLYKALIADQLINSKDAFVTIDLLQEDIYVNDKKLKPELIMRYRSLTEVIGAGPDRKVKLSKEYIKVGDFTEDGFKGIGFGTFTEEFADMTELEDILGEQDIMADLMEKKFELEDLFALERNALMELEKNILDVSENSKRPGLFGVHLKYEECRELHGLLYQKLIQDKYVASNEYPAIIEFGEDKVKVNGVTLASDEAEPYRNLFAIYKIKPGPSRSIRLTKHIIKVGDFGAGSFTGTSSIID